MSQTYLTTDQLAERIHYDVRDRLKDSVLLAVPSVVGNCSSCGRSSRRTSTPLLPPLPSGSDGQRGMAHG